MLKKTIEVPKGSFDFFSDVRFLGGRFRTKSSFSYRRVNDGEISYSGKVTAEIPSRLRPFGWLVRAFVTSRGSYLNRIGGEAAAEITLDPNAVERVAGRSAAARYLALREEEAALRRGARNSTHYVLSEGGEGALQEVSELPILKRRLQSLESRVAELATAEKLRSFSWQEFHESLEVFSHGPRSALVTNRRIVERIAKLLFESETCKPAGSRMLGELLDQLAKEMATIPNSIIALMRIVNLLGAVGGHVDSGSAVSVVDHAEYGVSFGATIRVSEWFLFEYMGKSVQDGHAVDRKVDR